MIDVIKNRSLYYAISWVLTVIALIFMFAIKLNLWIDMTGWTQTEYQYTSNLDIEKARETIVALEKTILSKEWKEVINSTEIFKITWEKKFSIIAWFDNSIEEKTLETYKIDFKTNALEVLKKEDSSIIETQYINIGKSFWDYIKNTAILTLILALFGIAIYLAWAFSWVLSWWRIILSFAWIVIITLFHDVIVAAWFYIFTSDFYPEFKVDTFFVTALLTILWYSISDTIVVFDRVRHNLKLHTNKKKDTGLWNIVNLSINEMLTRSIYTSLMVMIVLVSIFIWWPDAIKWFVLTMIYWTLIWTYSSIFIAAPMLYDFNKSKKLELYEKKEMTIEDKIVV